MASNPDNIRAITGSTLDDTALEPFQNAAACVMDQARACAQGKGVPDACLDQSEDWLASHYLSISKKGEDARVLKSERFENYTVQWAQSQIEGQNIMSTTYGQTANQISAGCLSEVGKSPVQIGYFG